MMVKKQTVWSTTRMFKDGTTRAREQKAAPGRDAGDVATVRDRLPVKHAP